MYQITDGNEYQRVADWTTMIATLESWAACPDLDGVDEGDIVRLRTALEGSGYMVEEVA
jgi:hypothetical protein